MIQVRVVVFAALRNLLGKNDIILSLRQGDNLIDLLECLIFDPGLRKRILKSTTCAVNYEAVPWDALLKSGDEVAFLPPMSGG